MMEATNHGGEVAARWRGGGIEVAASSRERSHGALGGGRQRVSSFPGPLGLAGVLAGGEQIQLGCPARRGWGCGASILGNPPPPAKPHVASRTRLKEGARQAASSSHTPLAF